MIEGMPNRSSKAKRAPADPNVRAFLTVQRLTGGPVSEGPAPEKNPHAVALGKLGGLKGGKARAKKLSAKRRSEIARKAAKSRWKSTSSQG